MQTALPDRRPRSPSAGSAFKDGVRWGILRWDHPVWSAVLAMVVYTIIAAHHGGIWQASRYAYFNYLADALLQGQLHLSLKPRSTHDLSLFDGRYYLYWPPFPAVVLMPFVAVWGIQFSDILFTIGIGGLNVALIAILLRQASARGMIALSAVQRGLLVLCFALGSTHLTLAPYGRVWYTAQLIGLACVALAYLAAVALRGWPAFLLAGLALSGALLTRNHLALAGLWPAALLLQQHWPQATDGRAGWLRLGRVVLAGLLPVVLAVTLLGLYNWLRFGSALDNGLAYHRMSAMFRQDYEQYGAFNLHYLGTNFRYQFLAYPFPLGPETDLGGSLVLLTPVFAGALWALVVGRPRWSVALLGLTTVLVALPILLLMGTGWRQFGPRYTLDFMVPLLLLTALGIRRWPSWVLALLTLISIVHYLIGTIYLGSVI